ncbi:MAG TPA: hypothetical protein VEK79_01815 [Thermoanaerobaculia bacterium]|nr:hypothetical protein [Thermoanaerobaculia bacterium]
MTAGDSIVSPSDRDLMKRLTIALVLMFVFAAAFTHLERTYARKFFDNTGGAQWIWAQHRMSDGEPVAFFAARDFTLPEHRVFTKLKIAGDPEYTVFFNGREVAGRRLDHNRFQQEERVLDLYDVSNLARTGHNRIVIAVRAPQGTGGLIASIDIGPEAANWVVTDDRWKIYRGWDARLLLRDVPNGYWQPPQIVGPPPIGRWNYLQTVERELTSPPMRVTPPREVFPHIGRIPLIRMAGGVAVAGTDEARGTVFDFGFTKGHVRVIDDGDRPASKAVQLRFAFASSELGLAEWNLRPIVFAPGEHVITTPEVHDFRYVMVFGGKNVRAEVVN